MIVRPVGVGVLHLGAGGRVHGAAVFLVLGHKLREIIVDRFHLIDHRTCTRCGLVVAA